jgi:CRISPR/Cas system-associated endoribonuclease Cas2
MPKKSKVNEWLLLVYKMPAEPSRYRVSVWRHIKESGAIYIQNSVCVLPKTPENLGHFESVVREIDKNGCECLLMESSPFDEANEQKLLEKFNQERNLEYFEFIEQCQAFLEEIRMEIGKENFTYAELEENDEAFNRLSAWLKKIKRRDMFSASRADEALKYFAQCQEALEDFASRVYAANQAE